MKKINFLVVVLMMLCAGFVSSCSDDDEVPGNGVHNGSLRDGNYSGDNLTLFIDGTDTCANATAKVYSDIKSSTSHKDENGNLSFDDEFYTTITIANFPKEQQTTVLKTELLGYKDIAGEVTIDKVAYDFKGEFTGTPLDAHEKQGLIIYFTAK